MAGKVSIHKQCLLSSIVAEWACRFPETPPNMYETEEMFRLHGVYKDHLSEDELQYLNEELQKKAKTAFVLK